MTSHPYDNQFSWESPYGHAVRLLQSLDLVEGDTVVDLGCGFGHVAEAVRDLGLIYLGADLDASGLQSLDERGFETATLDLNAEGELGTFLQTMRSQRRIAAVMMLDVLEHLHNPESVLRSLHAACSEAPQPSLVLSVPNVAHFDLSAKLLVGRWDITPSGLLDRTHLHLFTESRLRYMSTVCGWREVAELDLRLHQSDQHFPSDLPSLASGALLSDYLRRLRELADPFGEVNQFVRLYVPSEFRDGSRGIKGPAAGSDVPRFTVIVRTQGRRPETLADALLCLAAQTCEDFELLLCVHSPHVGIVQAVRSQVADFAARFTRRIQILQVPTGGRATPLNRGLDRARGDLVAFLDDDDVVAADWLEVFDRGACANPGSIVRAVAADRPMYRRRESPGFAPNGSLVIDPARGAYNALTMLVVNRTPICSFAVPMNAVETLNLRFREELPVLEDYDFLLRAATYCGVTDTRAVTSIYHRWKSGEASIDTTSRETWKRTRERIVDDLDSRPFLLPAGSARGIADLIDERNSLKVRLANAVGPSDGTTRRLERTAGGVSDTQQQLERRLAQIESSTSWRITRPLRWFGDRMKAFRRTSREV